MRFLPIALLAAFAFGLSGASIARAQTTAGPEAQGNSSSAASRALVYKIDPAPSEVTAKVRFMALSKKSVSFPKLSGDIQIFPNALSQITLDVKIDARQLEAKDDFIRDTLKGSKFFDVENHPTLRFVGHSLTMSSAKKGVIEGQLTARGITLPQQLKVEFSKPPASADGREEFTVNGQVKIDRKDYGMTAYPVIVGNRVDIRITAHVVPQSGGGL